MGRIRNKATGAITEVDDSTLGEVAASGEYDLARDAMVPVVASDGTVGSVPASQVRGIVDGGGRLASGTEFQSAADSARYSTVGQKALTAVEGAGRGLTAGLLDPLLQAAGADMEAMRGRRDENPLTAGITEIGGTIAPLLLSGGGSAAVQGGGLLARGAGAARAGVRAAGVVPRAIAATGEAVTAGVRGFAGESAAARALATAAGGTIEGAAVGLGQSLSGAALGDHELTAEQIFADMGSGAMFGGVAGAGLSLAASGVTRVAESGAALMNRALRSETAERLSNRFAFSAAARGTKKKRFVEDADQFMGPNGAEVVGEIALRRGIVSTENRSARSIHEAARREQTKAGADISAILRTADDAGARVNIATTMQRIEAEVIAPLQAIGGATSARLAKKVRAEFGEFLGRGSMRRGADGKIQRAISDHMVSTRDLQQWRVNLDSQMKLARREGQYSTADALLGARQVVENEIESAIVAQVPDLAGSYKAAKREYSGVKLIADASKDTIKTEQANRLMSLTDYTTMGGAAAAFGASPAALAAALVTGVANKVLREQGSAFAAGTIRNAMKRAGGVQIAQSRAVEGALKIASGASTRVRTIAPIVAASGGGTVSEAFERRAARVAELSAQPAKMLEIAERAAGHVPGTAPGVQAAMGANVTRAVGFLQSKMPHRLQSNDPLSHLRDRQKVTTHQALQFMRYANAIEDPRSVLKSIGNGSVTRAEMEALQAVYPKMHAQIVEQVVRGVADLKEAPSLDSLTHLSIVTGVALHPSLQPANIAAAQAIYAQQPSASDDPMVTPGNATPPNAKTARSTMSRSESIESGG